MRHGIAAIALLVPIGIVMADEASIPLTPLWKLEIEKDEVVLSVAGGEATVNDSLIRRFAFGKQTVTASYYNQSNVKSRPCYTVEFYNRYGLLLGESTVGTSSFSLSGPGFIKPRDVGTERLHVEWYPLKKIISKSAISLPEEWEKVTWVVIKNNNPRTIK